MPDNGLPEGWHALTVGELAEVVGGSTPSRGGNDYFGGPIPWATPTDITTLGGKRYISETAGSITEAGRAAAGLRVLPAGTILMTSRATIGDAAIAEVPMTTNQGFQSLVPKDGVQGLWLYYAVTQKRALLNRLAAGSTFKEVSRGTVRTLELAVPPPDEQRRIAEVLDAIDAAIEKTEAVIAATERLRAALLGELLTRGVPGWHTEWKQVPGIGTIPACWDVGRLGDVAEVNRRSWDPRQGGRISYIDIGSVSETGLVPTPAETDARNAPSRARRVVRSGDVLVSTVRPYLRAFLRVENAAPNLVASTGFAVLTPCRADDSHFVYYHVLTERFIQHLVPRMTGSGYPAVRPSDVVDFRIGIPEPDERRAVGEVLAAVDERLASERGTLELLSTIKRAVAAALLSGRVRVHG